MILKNLLQSCNYYGCLLNQSKSSSFPYLYGIRQKQCIINLKYTIISLKRSLLLIQNFIKNKKKILIISNDSKINYFKKFINHKNVINIPWEQGSITKNSKNNKINLIILFNLNNNKAVLNEARICKIPIISFIDTNQNPNQINYPILTNSNNVKSFFILIYFFNKILCKN